MSKIQRVAALLGVGLCVSRIAIGQPQPGPAAPVVAEAFGPNLQLHHIGAAEFQHLNNVSGYEFDTADGYLTYNDPNYVGVFVAPLVLPSGAGIFSICAYFFDSAPVGKVTAYVEAVKFASLSTGPGVVPVMGPIEADTSEGYSSACNAGNGYTMGNFKDVDGDGLAEYVIHRIRVDMTETGEGRLALAGVQVSWSRQVSPSPTGPSFGDVMPEHPQFQFIEALATSGVSVGCGGGLFCPDTPLTRGQMAVFLAKALGLHWPL